MYTHKAVIGESQDWPRTTESLDLKNLDKIGEARLAKLLHVLRTKKKIVVIVGAGISVSAGIPVFRSKEGLFEKFRNKYNTRGGGENLFDISVYNDNQSTAKFHEMVCELSNLSRKAKPTPFHHMLATIANERRLLRLYTQNIDCLETSLTPLATKIPLPPKKPWPVTIQVHGGLDKMQCTQCNRISDFDAALFQSPEPPLCESCKEQDDMRTKQGKRSHGVGRLKPRILLYNDSTVDSDAIGKVCESDLRTGPDAVLVVGTSLKVLGMRRITQTLCQTARSRNGLTAWINPDREPQQPGLKELWDFVVYGESDEIAGFLKLPRWDHAETHLHSVPTEASRLEEEQCSQHQDSHLVYSRARFKIADNSGLESKIVDKVTESSMPTSSRDPASSSSPHRPFPKSMTKRAALSTDAVIVHKETSASDAITTQLVQQKKNEEAQEKITSTFKAAKGVPIVDRTSKDSPRQDTISDSTIHQQQPIISQSQSLLATCDHSSVSPRYFEQAAKSERDPKQPQASMKTTSSEETSQATSSDYSLPLCEYIKLVCKETMNHIESPNPIPSSELVASRPCFFDMDQAATPQSDAIALFKHYFPGITFHSHLHDGENFEFDMSTIRGIHWVYTALGLYDVEGLILRRERISDNQIMALVRWQLLDLRSQVWVPNWPINLGQKTIPALKASYDNNTTLYVAIPCLYKQHWFAVVYDYLRNAIYVLDSLQSQQEQLVLHIRELVSKHLQRVGRMPEKCIKLQWINTHQQKDSWSCGLHLAYNLRSFLYWPRPQVSHQIPEWTPTLAKHKLACSSRTTVEDCLLLAIRSELGRADQPFREPEIPSQSMKEWRNSDGPSRLEKVIAMAKARDSTGSRKGSLEPLVEVISPHSVPSENPSKAPPPPRQELPTQCNGDSLALESTDSLTRFSKPELCRKVSIPEEGDRYRSRILEILDADIKTLVATIIDAANGSSTTHPLEHLLTERIRDFATQVINVHEQELAPRERTAAPAARSSEDQKNLPQAHRSSLTAAAQRASVISVVPDPPVQEGWRNPKIVDISEPTQDSQPRTAAPGPTLPPTEDKAISPLTDIDDADLKGTENSLESHQPQVLASPVLRNHPELQSGLAEPPRPVEPHLPRKRVCEDRAHARLKKAKHTATIANIETVLNRERLVRQFMNHVCAWRAMNKLVKDATPQISGTWNERTAGYYKLANAWDNSSNLHRLLSWIAKVQAAKAMADQAEVSGFRILPASMVRDVLVAQGVPYTTKSRQNFQEWLRQPRKLMHILGSHLGLLPFIPINENVSVTLQELLSIPETEISSFQSVLEGLDEDIKLSAIGQSFQNSVISGTHFPDMIWEKIDARTRSELAAEHIVPLIPVQHIQESIFEKSIWAGSQDHPWKWLERPDSLLPGALCDICGRSECSCIQTCFPESPPRIAYYGRRGLGLQATATNGSKVYEKGQLIGQFVGRFFAPGTHKNGLTLDFIRSDLEGEPTVAQLYIGNESNVFRFVSHRCKHPSATVRGTALSQKYRMVLYALREIEDEEEITIDFGPNFRNRSQCLCQDCL